MRWENIKRMIEYAFAGPPEEDSPFALEIIQIKNGIISISENGFWELRSPPNKSLEIASELFNKIKGKILVEIGTGIHGELAGNSMLVWPKKTSAEKIIAIDLESARLEEVREATKGYSNIELILTDGIDFLRNFSFKIDLLYLDFWTPDPGESIPGTGRSNAYLDAYIAAKPKMNNRSIILIDDTDHIHPWKHTLVVPEARKDGFKVLYTGRQTLLMR